MKRPWTSKEKARLRRHYKKLPTRELAARLGRTPGQVHQTAARLGLTTPRPEFTAAQERRLRRLHAQGLTDAAIARRMNLDRRWLRERRAALGLPVNTEAVRQVLRDNVRRQAQSLGIRHGGDLRRLAFRAYARRHGWPEDLPPRCVQILDLLHARGPMTRRQLAAALGFRTEGRPSRRLLKGRVPGGSYPGYLLQRGLIIALGRVYCRQYFWEQLYALSLSAERRLS